MGGWVHRSFRVVVGGEIGPFGLEPHLLCHANTEEHLRGSPRSGVRSSAQSFQPESVESLFKELCAANQLDCKPHRSDAGARLSFQTWQRIVSSLHDGPGDPQVDERIRQTSKPPGTYQELRKFIRLMKSSFRNEKSRLERRWPMGWADFRKRRPPFS